MATTLHSFTDIFNAEFGDEGESVQLKKIIIPIIQRDYAQGRKEPEVARVRQRFLDSLYNAVLEVPIKLDFIYGDIDDEGNMTPLDGQQRLTTLFLLHWYAAKKANLSEDEYNFLNNFSYETRYSARYFCADLVDFTPKFDGILSKEIVNQSWFPLDWENDPTISSMLVMLDAIDEKFNDVENLWNRLKDNRITFYFLPIKDMGLTDELYIKMNSRGKPLTQFEHFKAELEREIRSINPALANRIISKIDIEWTDLLWEYRNSESGASEDNIIDDGFLRYFLFICDVICYRQNESTLSRSNDEFDLLERYFSSNNPEMINNVETLEGFFDCWCNIDGYNSPTEFLSSFMSTKHEKGKILIDSRNKINIFEDCLHSYSEKSGRSREFPLNRMVLLYAISIYLQNTDKITADEFKRRIRIVYNLILNSEDEISDRTDRNRMPAILLATDAIIITGSIDESINNSYNVNQLSEEKEKINYLLENPSMEETLFRLEDHSLLRGQISIVGIENLHLTDRFFSLFKCNKDKIDCAMTATGDFYQVERNRWRYQFGSTMDFSWHELFHKSANSGFDRTHNTLITLLKTNEEFSNETLQQIAEDYIHLCESTKTFTFRYYYIKYPDFRPKSYGKMSNDDLNNAPYLFSVMQTRSHISQNSYMPYLKAANTTYLSKDDYGQRLIFEDEYIECSNSSFLRKSLEDDSILEKVQIPQNEEGIDKEDRIIILKNFIKDKYSL